MSPGKISEKVVADRLAWIEEMVVGVRALPLTDFDAFVQDRNYSECVNMSLMEVKWGIRTARQIANLINNTPEIVYRILRNGKTRSELLRFVDAVPYSGPGRHPSVKGMEKGSAFRIKMENPYIVEKLKELGVPLNVIFPGG